ncbi:unnamed protein product [Lymnaea stagnalis]|uniref:DNA repair protein XRCC1 n=1 Tax=Lymnaea stagnalis TaxID=6523 RepID=A0AAV2H868_LYMST
MPDIGLQHVISCSSADKNNPAENLLVSDGTHKWKCATAGEKSISCILQFSHSCQIHSLDIGNEGSAFVEVLVGKATATSDEDFEVLLVASSFMTPLESRNGTNRNAVRMFGPDKLNKLTASKSWDRVKVVCTQPFSKTSQYGLSFIKFHSPPDHSQSNVTKLGAFSLKECDDDEDIQVGTLFANRSLRENPSSPVPKALVAKNIKESNIIKEESPISRTASAKKRQAPSPPSSSKAKTLKQMTYDSKDGSDTEDASDTEDETEDHHSQTQTLRKQRPHLGPVSRASCKTSSTEKPSLQRANSASSKTTSTEKPSLQRKNTEPTPSSPAKVFSRLMEGVVFVLSGFQNPQRGELRDKALEMGAKYRPDWGRGCTHLICAFTNTPKYQQVAGQGKIVTKSWINDSYKQKKLLPWRNYRLGTAPSPPDSGDEKVNRKPEQEPKKRATPKTSISSSEKFDSDSSCDTDAENLKAEKRAKTAANPKQEKTTPAQGENGTKAKKEDPYCNSTDDDDDEKTTKSLTVTDTENDDTGLPDLPDFFADKVIFFYGDMDPAEQRLLTRYIAAYNGEISDYMSQKVNYVITAKKWDENFDLALSENANLVFVKPKWIYLCHEKKALLPYQPYVIVP